MDSGAVALGDLERAVRRAGVPDEELDLAVDDLRAEGSEHLVGVGGAVEPRDREGDDRHQPSRRRLTMRPAASAICRRLTMAARVARTGAVRRHDHEASMVARSARSVASSRSSAGTVAAAARRRSDSCRRSPSRASRSSLLAFERAAWPCSGMRPHDSGRPGSPGAAVRSAGMRVAFVVPTLEPSGGIHVALRHARLLHERGWDVGVVVVDPVSAMSREPQPLLRPTEAAATDWDVVVATWWSTWDAAMELPARRHALLLQGVDERFYDWRQPFDRLAASAVLAEAGAIIAVSEHLREVVAALRPGAEVHVVRNGLDRNTFGSMEAARDETSDARPFEILIEGQRNLPLKGVDDAVAAVR